MNSEVDYSAVHDPVLTSVRCLKDYLKCIETGTPELRHILCKEVDVILECKVCRKLFRSLANLFMHKQAFCKSSCMESVLKFPDFISKEDSSVTIVGDEQDCVDGMDIPVEKNSSVNDIANTKTSDYQHGSTSCSRRKNRKSDKVNIVKLEKIDSNCNAVYQSVDVIESDPDESPDRNIPPNPSTPVIPPPELESQQESEIPVKDESTVDEGNWKKFCNTSSLTCNICDQNYSSLKTLKFHCLHLHGKMRTFYPCLYCKLLFCQPWSCRRHMERSHQKTREQVLKLNEIIKKKSFSVPLDDLNTKGMPKVDPRNHGKILVKMNQKDKSRMKMKVVTRGLVKQEPSDMKRRFGKRDDSRKCKSDTNCSSPVSVEGSNSKNQFPCFNCGREYDVKGSLNKHLQRRSCFDQDSLSDKRPKRRELSTVLNMDQMKKVNRLIDRNRMQCRRCNRKFTNVSNLNRHAIRHVGISRFKCSICEFRCYNMGECRRHLLNTHRKTDYQKYVVDIEDDSADSTGNATVLKDVKSPNNVKNSYTPVRRKLIKSEEYATSPSRSRRKQDLSRIRSEYGVSTRSSPKQTPPTRCTSSNNHKSEDTVSDQEQNVNGMDNDYQQSTDDTETNTTMEPPAPIEFEVLTSYSEVYPGDDDADIKDINDPTDNDS